MRIRTIKPEFFTHEGLYEAEKETKLPLRVAFAGLWCVADREGRFKWEPRRIGVAVLPYDGCDFSRVLDALTTRGFIVKYRVGDAWFGVIPSFSRHQIVNNRESASVLPELSLADESDATTTREARDDHASKAEGKGREGKGTGKEGEETNSTVKGRGTVDEVVAFCNEIGLPKTDGQATFDKWEGNGWVNGGSKIKDWRATIRSWKTNGYMPSQKNGSKSQGINETQDLLKNIKIVKYG